MATETLSPEDKTANKLAGALALLNDIEYLRFQRGGNGPLFKEIKLEGLTPQREDEFIHAVWNFAYGVLTQNSHSPEAWEAFAAYYSFNGETHKKGTVLRKLTEEVQLQSRQEGFSMDYYNGHTLAERRFSSMIDQLVDHAIVPRADSDQYHLANARRIVTAHTAH